MKTLRQTCAAIVLSLTLAVSATAGHMDTMGAPAPAPAPEPSPTPSASTTSTVADIVMTLITLVYR